MTAADPPADSAPAAVPAQVFKDTMGGVPAAVTVVTTIDGNGGPTGLTVSAFSVVSLEPPQVLVCLDKRSKTLRAIRQRGHFTVNFLAAGNEELALRFASKITGKFDGVVSASASCHGCGPILIEAAYGYALCALVQAIEAGDHWILVGHVLEARRWAERVPLMYCRRTFGMWPRGTAEPRQTAGARRTAGIRT